MFFAPITIAMQPVNALVESSYAAGWTGRSSSTFDLSYLLLVAEFGT
jgi:hypothetical protein